MRQHFLAAWLWASLAFGLEPQQQSCQFAGKQEQSYSLIQSTSAKQKITFKGEELLESPPKEAPSLPPSLLRFKDAAAKSLEALPLWLNNVTVLGELGGRRLVREPSSAWNPVWVILLIISAATCTCALCSVLDPFGYNSKQAMAAAPGPPADPFGVKVPPLSHMPTRPPTSSEPLPEPNTQVLCPGLVVPVGCECTLLVPRLVGTRGQVSVDDIKGVPVLRASFNNRLGSTRVLVLTSSTQEATVFAYCVRGKVAGEFAIHDSVGRPFGSCRVSQQSDEEISFEVSTYGGSEVRLWFKDGNELCATDTRLGQALASATAAMDRPACRKVRIGPLVDAGLLTVAVLASDLLIPSTDVAGSDYMSPRVRHMDGQPSTAPSVSV